MDDVVEEIMADMLQFLLRAEVDVIRCLHENSKSSAFDGILVISVFAARILEFSINRHWHVHQVKIFFSVSSYLYSIFLR